MKKVISTLAIVLTIVCTVNFCFADTTTNAEETADTTEAPLETTEATEASGTEETTDASADAKAAMTDVNMDSELGKSIAKLIEAGVVNGYPEEDGTYTYRPDNHITRAEFCKMINTTFGYEVMSDNIFSDVDPSQWYYIHVLTAINEKYINGYTDGTFRGEANITREEACTVLSRIIKRASETEVTITDTVSEWAKGYVENIVGLGYMPLEEDGTFRATENLTRGELALTLDDLIEKKDDSASSTVTDGATPSTDTSENTEEPDFSIKPNQSSTDPLDSSIGTAGGNRPSRPSTGGSNKDDDDDDEDEDDSGTSGEEDLPDEPTEEELEASMRIYDSLEYALEDIAEKEEMEVLDFSEKGLTIFNFLKDASQEVLALRDEDFVVSNTYVRSTYASEIEEIKGILDNMTTEERDAFEFEVNKLNTVTITDLVRIFNVNINYGKD